MYEGCEWSSKDVLIVLEMFKVIGHMGDGLENIILGLISSILPKKNSISERLKDSSKSNYFFQQTIKSGHQMFKKHRIFEISACRKGCFAFLGAEANEECCPICNKPNDSLVNEKIYYFPFRDRIRYLLMSDLKKILNYSNIRRPPTTDFIEDIYDGENWKWFERQMDPERYGLLMYFELYTQYASNTNLFF